MFFEHSLCARHWTRNFVYTDANSVNSLLLGNVIAPVLWARKLKLRRLYNLPKITQLKGGNVQAQHKSDS